MDEKQIGIFVTTYNSVNRLSAANDWGRVPSKALLEISLNYQHRIREKKGFAKNKEAHREDRSGGRASGMVPERELPLMALAMGGGNNTKRTLENGWKAVR